MMMIRAGADRRSVRNRRRPVLEIMERRELLATFLVTNTADDGAGSFRQAILDANTTTGPNLIQFHIGSGPQTIIPATPLPTISNPVTIDGASQPGFAGAPLIQIDGSQIFYPDVTPPIRVPDVTGLVVTARSTVRGLAINRFTGSGILLQGSSGSTIAGNYLGVDLSGETPLGNTYNGIGVVDSRNNVIGGTTVADRNVISGNLSSGIIITTASNQPNNGGNIISGNLIGTDVTGQADLGNQFDGVTITTSNNTIGGLLPGAANIIAHNGGSGVAVSARNFTSSPLNTPILSNPIYANGSQAINLGFQANDPVSSAALNSAYQAGASTVVEGRFRGAADRTFTLQFFSNPTQARPSLEEGRTLVGTLSVATDDFGQADFTLTLPTPVAAGQYLSATATDPSFNTTSEFFGSVLVTTTARADVGVSMSASADGVFAGSPLTYFINVVNGGPSNATNVTLTDAIPGGMAVKTVTAPKGTVTQAGGVVTVRYAQLSSGDSRSVQITVVPATIGNVTNTVTVKADQTDLDPDNATASVTTSVVANPNPPTVIDQTLVVTQDAITGLILNFNQPLDPAQATNPINYGLTTSDQPGLFNVIVPLDAPAYDPLNSVVTLTPSQPLQLGKTYRLTINGQGSAGLSDLAGDLVVGNTPLGPQGPYVWDFSRGVVPQPQLAVATQNLVVAQNAITAIVLGFNASLDPAQAVNPLNYALAAAGPNGKLTQKVALKTPVYDPLSRSVTLTPVRPLQLGRLYQLTVNGQGSAGVVDQSGNLLTGNTPAGAQGPWTWSISRGYVPHPAPRRQSVRPHQTGHVRLVETATTRRILSRPGSPSSNALPPLSESSSTRNDINTNPS
ncbi:Ig-like domain-containing protein [Paludisphaera mucosa]|uniref:Ig-like domain-containing protein n=1 Tax=Paludisphaera mucosa TaxID=3030827 RepID=A0ABT6FC84_9BACT|nr:Ig-like domain-containing protein [Paludisphaera mucosa]MDG3005008.1 Ig-like domain-containing protein [Paludisphaera mucosa]